MGKRSQAQAILPTMGETGIDEFDIREVFAQLRREQGLRNLEGDVAKGGSIGIMDASRKYQIPHGTIWRWVARGLIPVVERGKGNGPGTATLIDEVTLARVAAAYKAAPGRGKRTAVLSA